MASLSVSGMACAPADCVFEHAHLGTVSGDCIWGLCLGTVSGDASRIHVWQAWALGDCFLLLLQNACLTIVMIITMTSNVIVGDNIEVLNVIVVAKFSSIVLLLRDEAQVHVNSDNAQ